MTIIALLSRSVYKSDLFCSVLSTYNGNSSITVDCVYNFYVYLVSKIRVLSCINIPIMMIYANVTQIWRVIESDLEDNVAVFVYDFCITDICNWGKIKINRKSASWERPQGELHII